MKFDLSEITAIIRHRRTIYPEQFTNREVHREMVELMLSNAIWAPTHGKTQPWRFTVYSGSGRENLKTIIERLYNQVTHPENFQAGKLERMKNRIGLSSVVVAIAMARTPDSKIPELEEVEAVACAAQNLLLTAAAYGLGAFWSSPDFLYRQDAAEVFGYQPEDKMLGLIYLGYPSVEWPKSHRKPLEYVTRWVN